MKKLPLHFFIIPLFALAFLLVSCTNTGQPPAGEKTAPHEQGTTMPQKTPTPPFDGTMLTGPHTVILHTSMGNIEAVLDASAAPKTVTNFIALARAGYYNGLTFHRIIPGFMIQGGDPNGDGTGGGSVYGNTFEDEINVTSYGLDKKKLKDVASGEQIPKELAGLTIAQYYEKQGFHYITTVQSLPMMRGSLAMANRGPNTNGSQFFIIQGQGAPWLEGRHTVFGNVTKGLDILDAISQVPRGAADRPTEPVTFTIEVVN